MDDFDLSDDEGLARLLVDSRQLQSAPAGLVQRMAALGRGGAPRTGVADAARQLLHAVLAFDSWFPAPGLALEAVRAVGSDARQLLFEAGEHDVDVRVRRSAAAGIDGWSVGGQVLGPAGAGRTTLRCGAHEASIDWNAEGEFRFEPVPHGECVLRVEGEGWAAELPPFTLPASSAGTDG